jgi:hypothetical protein
MVCYLQDCIHIHPLIPFIPYFIITPPERHTKQKYTRQDRKHFGHSFLCNLDPPPMVKPFNQMWSHCYFSEQCTVYRTFCISLRSVAVFEKFITCICHNYCSYMTSNFQPVEIFCIYKPRTANNTKFEKKKIRGVPYERTGITQQIVAFRNYADVSKTVLRKKRLNCSETGCSGDIWSQVGRSNSEQSGEFGYLYSLTIMIRAR